MMRAGDQVGDRRAASVVAAAHAAPRDQDRRHTAHGPGVRVPARRTSSTRRRTSQCVPTSLPSTRVVPDAGSSIEQAAALLAAAERPMIFVGDGVAFSGAQAELTRVAELLGAEVWEARRRRSEHEPTRIRSTRG